ncbi:MAG: choice-of-anchor tandem repeat GloVer-containing protein [Candidatus Sulfotelmatobacter sp.]
MNMRRNILQLTRVVSLVFAIAILTPSAVAGAEQEKPLFEFNNSNGATPSSALIFDDAGNLYGATSYGGDLNSCAGFGCGVVFKLTPTSSGGWEETILHAFKGGSDGSIPDEYATLIFDAEGNLYGTTSAGGGSTACGNGGFGGCGTVFELSPAPNGSWKEKTLYRFAGGSGGSLPQGGLVFDQQGNLYGSTTLGGGSENCGAEVGCGVIFELIPNASGWAAKALHVFTGAPVGCQNCDGDAPLGTLAFDAAGNLYGTASAGGTSNHGTVFEFTPSTDGGWSYKTIYSFRGVPDGSEPFDGVVFDGEGNLYGTDANGGTGTACSGNCGTVFELSPSASGWTETTLYSFQGGTDGSSPLNPLVIGSDGSLYGPTPYGGGSPNCSRGCGTVFQLTPSISGTWTETVLFRFNEVNGSGPQNLIFDQQGNLYSTTLWGGHSGGIFGSCGIVFKLTP